MSVTVHVPHLDDITGYLFHVFRNANHKLMPELPERKDSADSRLNGPNQKFFLTLLK